MPLDSFSLEWIKRCYIKEKNLKGYEDKFDDSVWKQNAHKKEEYYMKQSENGPIDSWSKLEYEEEKGKKCTYKFYLDLLRDKLEKDMTPLWVDFYVWPRIQKIIAAEAFIKVLETDKEEKKTYGSCEISKIDETLENLLKKVSDVVGKEK